MDMAEKDETEGRCPACRNPYNKEKIVGTAAKCERLVSGMNVEKKLKSQKGKGKTSEGRKQLESVRVIQRNLVYVVGLPLDYADEDLLQRNEYFSQYGNVLKVSISRTATGSIQQFANSTCSVYITYSKEEEAVRCIQSVHGFVLDGRSLRACFGTTKYCHAWLRNVPCTNQDCLYLHETGSQEDSFTKDEIISAYTRSVVSNLVNMSRVQQITSSSNSMQRRSGNVLPPPADEYCNNSSASSGKPITKTAINTNNSASTRVSPPNSSSGRSAALPAGASWGARPASNNQALPTSTPPNQKPDTCNGPVALSKKVSTTSQVSSLQVDTGKKKIHAEERIVSREKTKTKTETFDAKEKKSNINGSVAISDRSVASVHLANSPSSRQPHSPPTTNPPPDTSNIANSSVLSSGPISDKNSIDHTDGNMENACSSILSMSIHENKQFQNGNVEHIREPLIRQPSGKAANTTGDVCVASVKSDYELGMQTKVTQVDRHESEDDVLSFDNQRINDPEIATSRVPEFSHVMNFSKHSSIHSHEFNNAGGSVSIGFDRHVVDRNGNLMAPTSNFPSHHPDNVLNSFEANNAENFNLFPSNGRMSLLGGYESEAASAAVGMGENNIISNILSMDFDPWGESLTSPQNMSKFVGDTDKRQGSFGAPGSWKTHNSNQSRFSFAREGEPISHVSGSGQSTDYYEQAFKQQHPFGHNMSSSNGLYLDRSVNRNGLTFFSGTEPDNLASSHSHISSNKLSASRSQISAPPGFSGPSRAAPPPGFTSHERTEPIFESLSGNHMLDASSLLRNQYQTPSSSNTFSNGDIEFIDPAILAVGKGTLPGGINNNLGLDMRPNFSPQLNTYEDARFQSLLQRSLPPHQNQRFTDMGNSFSNLGDAYGIPSRIMDQSMTNNLSPYSQFNPTQSRNGITSNGQWNGWSESQSGNNLGMAELLRNERLGFNKFYGGYEDPKIQTPSSGNLYNRTYGI
ncbi:ccr4-not transcription complex subunit 4 [Phtheirospermum japonicum]|uniref:Ccr4-not transcription complex subunit 4 n=1 Tax=Phtheirospermum japonicum TaxID=374723 RepID=A0A830C2H3_9LAMI|nr:ccr4-not transcription complex subunit 4 [Phtheirospermum japonicum]